MQLARPVIAVHPYHFGRGPMRSVAAPDAEPAAGDDLKLFATTFLAGFLFVSMLLA